LISAAPGAPQESVPEPPEAYVPEQPGAAVFDLDDEDRRTQAPVFDLDEEPAAPQATEPAEPFAVESPAQQDSGGSSAISSTIAPVLAELAAELKRSLDYYTGRYPDPVDALILSGGVSKLPGLAGYMEAMLGLPVSVGDPVSHLPMQAKRYGPEFLADISPVFSVCLGLALRDYAGGKG